MALTIPADVTWAYGYLPRDIDVHFGDGTSGTLDAGTFVRVYEGTIPAQVTGTGQAESSPDASGRHVLELPPGRGGLWWIYPADLAAKIDSAAYDADAADQAARLGLAVCDPTQLLPPKVGDDSAATLDMFGASPNTADSAGGGGNMPPTPPKSNSLWWIIGGAAAAKLLFFS